MKYITDDAWGAYKTNMDNMYINTDFLFWKSKID